MAVNKQAAVNSWITEGATILVVIIIAAHVIGLVFWMYRLATDKPVPRKKIHSAYCFLNNLDAVATITIQEVAAQILEVAAQIKNTWEDENKGCSLSKES